MDNKKCTETPPLCKEFRVKLLASGAGNENTPDIELIQIIQSAIKYTGANPVQCSLAARWFRSKYK